MSTPKEQIQVVDFAAFKPEPGTVLVVRVPEETHHQDIEYVASILKARLLPLGVADVLIFNGDVEIQALSVDRMQKLGWVRAAVSSKELYQSGIMDVEKAKAAMTDSGEE